MVMKITYIDKLEFIRNEKCIAAIGQFDGFHLGHLKLIDETIKIAKELKYKSMLITMDPDPLNFITNQIIPCITSVEQRIKICEDLGFDEIVILRVDKHFLNLTPNEFINDYLIKLNIHTLICGFDYRFANNASGNAYTLKSCTYFNTIVIDEYTYNNRKVSTTFVKELLKLGDITTANSLLYSTFKVSGTVIHGDERGRQLGYPTANLKSDVLYTELKKGVYLGYALIDDKKFLAMINVGVIPTFKDSKVLTIEGYILDFDNDIYDKHIEYEFIEYMRQETKFNSKEQLVEQLDKDKKYLIEYKASCSK